MLLANIAVAHRIYKVFPSKSILRRHPSPNQQQIEVVGELIRSYGFDCDIKSSNSIQVLQIESFFYWEEIFLIDLNLDFFGIN